TKETPGWTAQPIPGPRHTTEIRTPTGHTYTSTAPPLPGTHLTETTPVHTTRAKSVRVEETTNAVKMTGTRKGTTVACHSTRTAIVARIRDTQPFKPRQTGSTPPRPINQSGQAAPRGQCRGSNRSTPTFASTRMIR
ncbi:MAG TPA: hypothetical protein VGN49_09505, partial [Micrococcaceae bacterium]|nr:hypothetical protein [Micrococcaceae bacterium]